MLLGINVPEEEFKRMTDKEKLELINDAYGRTKQMRFRAYNAQMKLDILRVPMEYAFTILTEKEIHLLEALELGYLN